MSMSKTSTSSGQLCPAEERKALHKEIANPFNERDVRQDKAINDAAEQLLYVENDLEGCQLLCKAGDYYRRIGYSDKERYFTTRPSPDLERIDGKESDLLFIKIMIGFSKDHMASSRPKMVISYLHEALKRAEKLNDHLLQATVLLHLSSNQYLAGDYVTASKNYIKGRSIVEETNDPAIERILITSAVIHNTCTGQFREASGPMNILTRYFPNNRHRRGFDQSGAYAGHFLYDYRAYIPEPPTCWIEFAQMRTMQGITL